MKRGTIRTYLLSILLTILSSISVYAQDEGGIKGALIGEDGIIPRILGYMENNYFQYFILLFAITALTSFAVKWALNTGPLSNVIESDRQKTVIALIIGVITSNGIFFSLSQEKNLQIGGKVEVIWGHIYAIIGICIVLITFFVIYKKWEEMK